MHLETITKYLDQKKGAARDFPFGPDAMVYKVMGKMFALIALESSPLRMNLKCDPDHALALRSLYPSVLPGYHMNKSHWNTIILDGTVPDDHICDMVDDSYDLVVQGLKKKDRETLK